MLHFISQKLTTGIRVRELLVLQALLEGKQDVITYVSNELLNTYNVELSEHGRINLINVMTNQFGVESGNKRHLKIVYLLNYLMVVMKYLKVFKAALENSNFKEQVQELVAYGLKQFDDKYKGKIYPNTPFCFI